MWTQRNSFSLYKTRSGLDLVVCRVPAPTIELLFIVTVDPFVSALLRSVSHRSMLLTASGNCRLGDRKGTYGRKLYGILHMQDAEFEV